MWRCVWLRTPAVHAEVHPHRAHIRAEKRKREILTD